MKKNLQGRKLLNPFEHVLMHFLNEYQTDILVSIRTAENLHVIAAQVHIAGN